MKRFTLPVICLGSFFFAAGQQPVSQVQLRDFELQSSAVAPFSGPVISSPEYTSPVYWFPVKVPCTVLTGLVANHVYPDPYSGLNNMLIPDASDSFNHLYHLEPYSHIPGQPNPWKHPYWYRTRFSVPKSDAGRLFQLIFKGINYRAEVWVNGQLVADSSKMAGMFAEYSLDVSRLIRPGEPNGLAVKIFPPDVPGLPAQPQLRALDDFFANGGPDGDIGKNVTMLSSVGWDWIPEVHDRNMGIWQPVYLRTSGQLVIENPVVVTDLPALPDTSLAQLTVGCTLVNHAGKPGTARLTVTITPETFNGAPVSFSRSFRMEAGESRVLRLAAGEISELTIRNPHLWWPVNYGRPDLYRIRFQVSLDGVATDMQSLPFGIRTVSSHTAVIDKWVRRDFFVNGVKVHLVGGAWVPDMMLNRDATRYDQEMRLCRNANVNLVRVWGGGLGETDDFYAAADRYGLLVWQDFWVTGDTHGEFKGSADNPPDGNIFIRNVVSTILRVRNHPSLLVWTGGNEGHARKELFDAMRNQVAELDGTRPFIPSSSGFAKLQPGWDGSWPDNQPSGVYSGGPYSWQDAREYYRLVNQGRDWVFKDETGLPSQPPYSSLPKIIPNLIPDNRLPFPLNDSWGYHDACSGNGHYETYYKAMADRYGAPASIRDFCDKMQLVNADAYRGIFEAVNHQLNATGGVMLWKLNAAFPSVVWQVYDWYLQPNAGYYFMQGACEPLHIQLNLDDSVVAIVNRSVKKRQRYSIEAELTAADGTRLYRKLETTAVDAIGAREVFSMAEPLATATGIVFVNLRLRDQQGNLVSRNSYWFHPQQDFTGLRDMKKAEISARTISSVRNQTDLSWTIRLANTSGQQAFFMNPQLMLNGEEVRPSYWSTNYFSLLPGESLDVTVSCPIGLVGNSNPSLQVSGCNIAGKEWALPLPAAKR